jgi:uncharacterized protein YukE
MDEQMDYPKMEHMSTVFRNGAQQLEDLKDAMISIADKIDDGALVGKAGDEFSDSLRSTASSSIAKIVEKFEEMAKDIDAAIQRNKDAIAKSKGQYK